MLRNVHQRCVLCRCHPPAISDGTVRTLTLGLADPATAPRSGAAAGARPQVRTAPAPLASRRLPPGPSRAVTPDTRAVKSLGDHAI